jgi:hypothetical protein
LTIAASAQNDDITKTDSAVSKNRVAVIPIKYMRNNNESREDNMGFCLQAITIDYLNKSTRKLKFIDATEIDTQLLKGGIVDSGLRRYTPKELAALLDVEYVIVIQESGRQVINIAGNGFSKDRIQQYGNETNHTGRNIFFASIVSNQQIEIQVSLAVYNETGEKIYSKSRRSMLSEAGAYKNTMHYLLKRIPLYKK